jgi:hypothetical protein
VDFLGSLDDVPSIGFGNENDLHGLMKLSAFSPLVNWRGVVGCITWLFRGVVRAFPTLSSSRLMSWGGVVRGCIAFTLWLLGFSKPLHSALKLGHRVFSHVIVCVLGIMVFPFSCQFDLAAYTGSKYYSLGEWIDCRDLPSVLCLQGPCTRENNQNT